MNNAYFKIWFFSGFIYRSVSKGFAITRFDQ